MCVEKATQKVAKISYNFR